MEQLIEKYILECSTIIEGEMVIIMSDGKVIRYQKIPKYIEQVFDYPFGMIDLLIIHNKKLNEYGK